MNEQIEALLIEREGYVRRGLKDRVKQVDAVLDSLGYKTSKRESAAIEPESERAIVPRANKRKG